MRTRCPFCGGEYEGLEPGARCNATAGCRDVRVEAILDDVFARVRRDTLGISDEAAAEMVVRWREYADAAEARGELSTALEWRRDAAEQERQLRGTST